MVNLFQRNSAEQGGLTAALLVLLEHCDRELLNTMLRKAGLPYQVPPGTTPSIAFPAPGGSPNRGIMKTPGFSLLVTAQAPGEPADRMEDEGPLLAVTPTGKGPPGAASLSWEQVDRLLAATAEKYDPQSRTGFLVRQFRDFLPTVGIAYFPGFDAASVAEVTGAPALLAQFYAAADQFFQSLQGVLEGLALLRQAGPADLLTGYAFRDYGRAGLGPDGFLRIAFHLPSRELQVSIWHPRLGEALGRPDLLAGVRGALLWLWSPGDEQKIPLSEFEPSTPVDWAKYQAGVQNSLGFDHLADEGLVVQVTAMAEELLDALLPGLEPMFH